MQHSPASMRARYAICRLSIVRACMPTRLMRARNVELVNYMQMVRELACSNKTNEAIWRPCKHAVLPLCFCLCAFCPALNVLLMAVLARKSGELRLGDRGRCNFLSTWVSIGVSQAKSKSLEFWWSDICLLHHETARLQTPFAYTKAQNPLLTFFALN